MLPHLQQKVHNTRLDEVKRPEQRRIGIVVRNAWHGSGKTATKYGAHLLFQINQKQIFKRTNWTRKKRGTKIDCQKCCTQHYARAVDDYVPRNSNSVCRVAAVGLGGWSRKRKRAIRKLPRIEYWKCKERNGSRPHRTRVGHRTCEGEIKNIWRWLRGEGSRGSKSLWRVHGKVHRNRVNYVFKRHWTTRAGRWRN